MKNDSTTRAHMRKQASPMGGSVDRATRAWTGASYRQIWNLNIPLSLFFQAALYFSSHN